MACILHIETSTSLTSVALSKDGMLLHEETDRGTTHGSHASECLGGFIDRAITKLDEAQLHLDAVSISSGPGSYTGLRIGTSMAKGLCYGREAKLISIPTLQLLTVPLLLGDEPLPDMLCPMIDARRMEVYAAIYDHSLNELRPQQPDVVTAETYLPWLEKGTVGFIGNGMDKCREAINHPNARFIPGIEPLAKNMMPLAEKKLHKGQTEDVAYFTPHYLKEYQAKMPSNPLLK